MDHQIFTRNGFSGTLETHLCLAKAVKQRLTDTSKRSWVNLNVINIVYAHPILDYLMVCNNFKSFNKGYLAAYFCKLPNTYKLETTKNKQKQLMNSTHANVLRKLCVSIKDTFELLYLHQQIIKMKQVCGHIRALIFFATYLSLCHMTYCSYWMFFRVPHISMCGLSE